MNRLHEYARTLKTLIDNFGNCHGIQCKHCPYNSIGQKRCSRGTIDPVEYVADARRKLSDIVSRLITEEQLP